MAKFSALSAQRKRVKQPSAVQAHGLELLWCPHCGGEARFQDYGISSKFRWAVKCSNPLCGCGTPSALHTRPLAAAIWNRRLKSKSMKRPPAHPLDDFK